MGRLSKFVKGTKSFKSLYDVPKLDRYCKGCDREFERPGEYRRHRNETIRHNPFGARRFACDICPKTFTQIYNLRNHRRIHFGETVTCSLTWNGDHTKIYQESEGFISESPGPSDSPLAAPSLQPCHSLPNLSAKTMQLVQPEPIATYDQVCVGQSRELELEIFNFLGSNSSPPDSTLFLEHLNIAPSHYDASQLIWAPASSDANMTSASSGRLESPGTPEVNPMTPDPSTCLGQLPTASETSFFPCIDTGAFPFLPGSQPTFGFNEHMAAFQPCSVSNFGNRVSAEIHPSLNNNYSDPFNANLNLYHQSQHELCAGYPPASGNFVRN